MVIKNNCKLSQQQFKRIFIVGPSWVGDMMMAQSLLMLLKQNYPQATIDMMAPAWSGALVQCMPQVDNFLEMPIGHGKLALRQRYQLGKSLRQRNYDLAIVLPNSFKSALIPFFAKIPHRRGWRGEMRFGLLNDQQPLNKKTHKLMVQRYLQLGSSWQQPLPAIKFPQLQLNSQQKQQTLEKFSLTTAAPVMAFCPGAEFGPAKQWPAAKYAATAQHFLQKGWQVWLFGSAKDSSVAEQIQQQVANQCIDLTGKTSLAEAVDLLSFATVVVTNDSGLMHIAAALDLPLIAVFGATSSEFTPPLTNKYQEMNARVSCSPCFKRTCPLEHHQCMEQVQPQQVIDAIYKQVSA